MSNPALIQRSLRLRRTVPNTLDKAQPLAALMEPGGELVLPALLLLGLGGRFAVLALYGCGKWAVDTWLAGRRPQPTSSLRAPARN